MSLFSPFSNLRIGTKLGISAGIGVALVVAMTVSDRISGASFEKLNDDAGRQETVALEAVNTSAILMRAQLAARDLRLARATEQIEKTLGEVQQLSADVDKKLETLESQASDPAKQERFRTIRGLFKDYTAALEEIGKKQAEIIVLFQKRDEVASKWTRAVNTVVNSSTLPFLSNSKEIESNIYDAASAFKDARMAAWRYFALSEPSQVGMIATSAEQTVKQLNFARAATTDATVTRGIEGLLTIVPEFTGVLNATTAVLDAQNKIQGEIANPKEAEARKLLDEATVAATESAEHAKSQAEAALVRGDQINLSVSAVVVAILLGSAFFAAMTIGRPIRRIGEVLMELANGNKAVEIPFADRKDEVGDNARAASTFKESLLRMERLEAEQKEVEQRSAAERKQTMDTLANEFEVAVGGIVSTVSSASTQLESAAGTLTRTAETTQQLAGVVAGASEEASSNVQSVASATEELTASVNEIGRQVQESSRIAGDAVKQAEKADARINQLSQAAQRIGDVVKLITAIAEQTNLLALNATIEAARAGEAGKGFAVVAQEVKALAAQTAKATDEISSQIAGMQAATQESVGAIQEIGGTIDRISEIASAIAAAVEEQGMAMQEIARNVQQAAQGTSEVATNITDVNRGASETGSSSAQVLSSAQSLSRESSNLKQRVDEFLSMVRAA